MEETAGTGGSSTRRDYDWDAAERSPEFRDLVAARRRFVLPATIFFLAWYFGFILLTAYAEDFMSESVYQGLTVGYTLALTQFVMVAVLGVLYLKRSEKVFDPLAAAAAQKAITGRDELDARERRDGAGDSASAARSDPGEGALSASEHPEAGR